MDVLVIGVAGSSAETVVPAPARGGVAARGLVHSPAAADPARQAGAAEIVVADRDNVDAPIDARERSEVTGARHL